MSDDHPRSPSFSEPLPRELLSMERQILADSAAWERRVPPMEPFTARLRAVLQEESMRDPETAPGGQFEESGVQVTGAQRGGPAAAGRWRALVATVAAIVVVGLLGAVFATLAPGHDHPATGTGEPTSVSSTPAVVPTPTLLAIHALAERPAITQQPGIPVVAQSDPQVMYEYADNQPGAVLRRSDDGGATWHDLALPQSSGSLGALYLAVSPLDASNVLLEMDVNIPTNGSCAVHADMRSNDAPASGGGTICRLMFRSQDGGNIWHPIQLPIAGSFFGNGVVFYYDSTVVQGQGNRLYARVYDKLNPTNPVLDIRILSTTDGGATWQPADTSLAQQAPHVCSYAATPVGSTLFAVSAASCLAMSGGTLWRSDDAGASWTRVGPAPSWVVPMMTALVAANANGDPNRPLLYATRMPTGQSSEAVEVSVDGGKTWQNAPTAGVPASAPPQMMSTAALPDGSIVAAFAGVPASSEPSGSVGPTPTPIPSEFGTPHAVSCYYWSPGARAWQRLTPAVTVLPSNLSNVFVSYNGAGVAVTLSIGDISTTSPLYTIQPFA